MRARVTPKGTAVYPHLTKPDTKFDTAGVYHVNLKLDKNEEAVQKFLESLDAANEKAFEEKLEDLKPAQKKKAKKHEVYEDVYDDDESPTGEVLLKFKMKHTVSPKSGKTFTQNPKLVDAKGRVLRRDKLNIGGGSIIKVGFEPVPFFMAAQSLGGITLRLKGVQILELVEYGDNPFEEEEGYEAPESLQGEAAEPEPEEEVEDEEDF